MSNWPWSPASPRATCLPEPRRSLAAHWRIDDALDTGQITSPCRALASVSALFSGSWRYSSSCRYHSRRFGSTSASPAWTRRTARNFRDKAQMKSVLRAAGVPCARHRLADSAAAAAGFAKEVGFPLVVKPPAGAGAKSTFRLDDAGDLRVWLDAAPPSPDRPALLEEFLSGR